MPIQIQRISQQQKEKILQFEEGHFLDFKSVEIAPGKLTRHISAFANADGGEIYIGIFEERDGVFVWRGFSNQEDANAHIQVFEGLFPLSQDFSYTFLECNPAEGLVLQILINKTRDIKIASDGKPYIRRGAQSLPVEQGEGLRQLELAKGLTSFESQTIDAPWDEITNSLNIIKFLIQIVPTAEPEVWLKKQMLIRDDKPTVAGVMLFADEPQAFLPKRSSIKIYRYQTSDAIGSRETLAFDPITIEGNVYDQIYSSVNKTVELINSLTVLGEKSLEKVNYPYETLHEIITNAVIHRDYSFADDIHIRIFDNRIEVESPGRLPAHITEDNILKERFSRNGTIVRLINKFPNPPNKDVGEGLNTAFEAMRKLRLKEPRIRQRENSVLVEIRHEPLATPEDTVFEYLNRNDEINNSKAREICHIGSENVMKRVFERLIDRDMIERIPDRNGRAIAYRKRLS
jgi:ATP-dependent DNA helicase RecG